MMKFKLIFFIMLIFLSISALWTDHFQPVYQGNGYSNMTVFIESASINGAGMEANDEIGIFDENLCVGSGVLINSIPPVFQITASADDPITPEVDGFIDGNPITFKLWDASDEIEILDITPTYSMGDGIFSQLGTAMAGLEGSVHFLPVYQWNGYNNMSFFIESATINGISLELKDEIGIFDGDLCVGAVILASEIPPVLQIICSADDPVTGEIDGFIDGNAIIYKFWDYSYNSERLDVEPSYTLGDGTFMPLGTAMVDLAWINTPPIANAGNDQTVEEGDFVQLDGSGSYDPDLHSITYLWNAPAGVTLSDPSAVDPTFAAPAVPTNVSVDYEFVLTVDDAFSIELREISEPDTVVITVENINQPPAADAGLDQIVDVGDIVTLDGSNSSDPDSDPLTYLWTAPVEITLSDPTAIDPDFTAPYVSEDTDFTITLVVNDGEFDSEIDSVIITVLWDGTGNDNTLLPFSTELFGNFPNPFNPSTTISFDIKENEIGYLTIFNLKGQIIVSEQFRSGQQTYFWNGDNSSSGLYFYQLRTDSEIITKKMILLK